MTDEGWQSWLSTLAQLDAALAELTHLRRQIAQVTAERDNWRAKSGQ
jgi:hypothetical protein